MRRLHTPTLSLTYTDPRHRIRHVILGSVVACQTVLHRLRADQRGATTTEYVLLCGLVLVVVLGAIQLFFGGIANVFSRLTSRLGGVG